MPKRSFAMAVAMATFASLALSATSQAGFITTVTAINQSGKAADDFEATFTGTGGSVSDITVLYSSGIPTTRGKPNNHVTKGKLKGQHFAFWAKDEGPEAESKDEKPVTTSNRG